MSVSDNKKAATRFLEAAGQGDVAAVAEIITDDAVHHTMGSALVSAERGHDELLELVSLFDQFTAAPIKFEFLTLTGEDDRVSVEARCAATLVDGRPYNNIYHCLFWIRDGRVARVHEYVDTKYTDEALAPLLARAEPAAGS